MPTQTHRPERVVGPDGGPGCCGSCKQQRKHQTGALPGTEVCERKMKGRQGQLTKRRQRGVSQGMETFNLTKTS